MHIHHSGYPCFRLWLIAAIVLGGAIARADAQSPANVLLVINDASPASREIGEYYAKTRGVPDEQIVSVRVDPVDDIAPAEFERAIDAPIGQWIVRHEAYDRILYIVLTKGIPLRVQGTLGAKATIASVDSELTLLYRKLAGGPISAEGPIANPYFLGDAPPHEPKPFTHVRQDIYLVTRLDGFTVEDVKGLIDRGGRPTATGTIVLDKRAAGSDVGDRWLEIAANRLTASFTDRVNVEMSVQPRGKPTGVLGYYSWGSNDPAMRVRQPALSFAPGALGAMFASGDARTFTEPPAAWTIGELGKEGSYFAGAPGSLTGDLVRLGITGVAGAVADPYLEGAIRPDILFPAYLAGRNLAESFYLAMPFLSWQTIVVGDPLCTLSHDDELTDAEASPELDAATSLPAPFSSRRLALMSRTGISARASALFLRAESDLRQRDAAGARQALEQATAAADRLAPAHVLLAMLYEQAREYDMAIERYRRVLALIPNDPIALNNLAYALAVHRNEPREALPLAEKAYAISNDNASFADTLGWIHHMLGDDQAAAPLLDHAVDRDAGNADTQLHAAIVSAAIGRTEAASAALAKALALDPSVGSREDATELRSRLDAAPR